MGLLAGDRGNYVESHDDPQRDLVKRLVDDFKKKLNKHNMIVYQDDTLVILQESGQRDEFTYCIFQIIKQGFTLSMVDGRGYHYFVKLRMKDHFTDS